jgi:hypothetical protein
MDNKYIFVPYEGGFDANIFWKEILYFWCKYSFTEGGKKETYLECDIRSKFMSYTFTINI